jgi:hypothetical protein
MIHILPVVCINIYTMYIYIYYITSIYIYYIYYVCNRQSGRKGVILFFGVNCKHADGYCRL